MGGFDVNELMPYYLDETEVCMRIIDLGHDVKPLANAIVHHKYLASHLRNHQRASDGTLRDTCVYSIIASEWPTVKAHLTYQLSKPRG